MTSRELQGLHRSGVGWNNELQDLARNKNKASRSSAGTKPCAKRPRASTTRGSENDPAISEDDEDGDLTQAQTKCRDQHETKRLRIQEQEEDRRRLKEKADRMRPEKQKRQQEKEEAERLRFEQEEKEGEERHQQQLEDENEEEEEEDDEVPRRHKRKGRAKGKQLDMDAKKKSTSLSVREVPCRYCFNQMIVSLGKVCHHQEKTTNRDKPDCHECNSLRKKCPPIKGNEFVKLGAKIHKISQKVNAQQEANRKAKATGGDKVSIRPPDDWEELKQEAINFLNNDKITSSDLIKDIEELKRMMKHQTTLIVKERAKNKAMRGQIRELTNQGEVSDDSSDHDSSESDSDDESVTGEDVAVE